MQYLYLENENKASAILLCKNIRTHAKRKSSLRKKLNVKDITNDSLPEILKKDKNSTLSVLGDIELELEHHAIKLQTYSNVFCDNKNNVIINPTLVEKTYIEDKLVIKKSPIAQKNIFLDDAPLRWTGNSISITRALRSYIFTEAFQLMHVNYLTYDFAFSLAKFLHDNKFLMSIGAGENGKEKIVLKDGGNLYNGFLEGRIDNDNYILLLRLSLV